MNITELKDQINNLNLLDVYSDIHGYAISTKEVNGRDTDRLCVKFYVKEKKSIDQLTADQILPTSLVDFGIDIITDVCQAGIASHLGYTIPDNNTSALLITEEESVNKYIQRCNLAQENKAQLNNIPTSSIMNTTYFNDPVNKTTDPIRLNYLKNRPLLGGSSSIYIGGTDATLGLLVTDSTDDSVVALSNNHVYAACQFTGKGAVNGNFINTTTLSSRQPGTAAYSPYASLVASNDCIGTHKRCITLDYNTGSNVDCAITQLTGYSLIQAMSTQVTGFAFKGPYMFASTQEIDSLMDLNSPNYQSPVFRNGRTLGPLGYPGNIYSKPHFYPTPVLSSYTPLISSSRIKSVRYVKPPFDIEDYNKDGTGIVIEMDNGDYYRSGQLYGTPNQLFYSSLEYLGNFTYFNTSNAATYGISAGKLVFCTHTLQSVGNSEVNATSSYKPLIDQLPSYVGVTDIILDSYANFILSGNSIYSVGKNGSILNSIGMGTLGNSLTAWTKIPGSWKSIDIIHALGGIIALSSSGDAFYCGGPATMYYNDIQFGPYFTNSYDLTANNLNIGKYKKLFIQNPGAVFTNYGLSATGGVITSFTFDFLTGLTAPNTTASFKVTPMSGVWGDDIKFSLAKSYIGTATDIMLSGNNVYITGTSLYSDSMKLTDFFKGSTFTNSRIDYTQFFPVTGVAVNNLVGWARRLDSNIYADRVGESLIFLSGGTWYCTGLNSNNIFTSSLSCLDEVVVAGIGYNLNVSGYRPDNKSTPFKDCLTIKSKNAAFPTLQGGDSGTAVFALLSSKIPALSAWKCIGLAFAAPGPSDSMISTCCRIDNIANQLKIKPWNGIIPTTKSVIKNISYSSALTAIPTITLSGRQFFNIGLTV